MSQLGANHLRPDVKGRVASGIYLYLLVAGEFTETKRMVLL